jgi:hypothetical protein
MTERTEAQWEIYRFELVFFNSRYGHWQLFGEKQGEDEGRTSDRASFYRQEIQSLLRSVRNAFYNESTLGVANGARSRMRVVDLPREGIRSSKIGVKFSEALKRRRGELTQRSIDLTLNALVEYYVRRTEEEALPPSVADRLTSFIRNILSAERESKEEVELTLSEALDLLSIVSPLEEWDVFGSAEKATHRVWKNGEWRRLFAYKISYPAMPKGTLPRENEDMGYPVILEICADCLTTGFDDATVRGAGGIPKEEGDYFEYCPKPKQVEGIIYDLYGLIVDELQQRS